MDNVRGTLNRVELLGWLGADPELRFTPGGMAICKLRIATKHIARGPGGERAFETDWTGVDAWDRLAERCNTYLHKGSRVMIMGSLRTDSWEDRESGQRRSRTYVRAEQVLFLDARPGEPRAASETDEADDADSAAADSLVEEADLPF